MESCGTIDEGAIIQALVVFVQFEPAKVDIYSELMAVWKVGDCCFCGFETLEKKFVRVKKVPARALQGLITE